LCLPEGVRYNHHRAKEYIAFLKKLNERCEKGKMLHIIADNYSTHKTKEIKEYRASVEGRFVTRFISARSLWLNIIERRFGKTIRRKSRESVTQLKKAIKNLIQTCVRPRFQVDEEDGRNHRENSESL
jgi:hypothetical protein